MARSPCAFGQGMEDHIRVVKVREPQLYRRLRRLSTDGITSIPVGGVRRSAETPSPEDELSVGGVSRMVWSGSGVLLVCSRLRPAARDWRTVRWGFK